MGLEKQEARTPIINILGSDGSLRLEVPAGTEGAVYREYERTDGTKGSKHELVYRSLGGIISNMSFYDGDFGTNLMVEFTYQEEVPDEINLEDDGKVKFKTVDKQITLSLPTASPFGEDFMKKLPSINLDEFVKVSPFSFEDDNGKLRRGVTVTQGDTKLTNYFYDAEKKKNIHKYPSPEGDTEKYTKDDWKIYFMQARKFLVKYTEENFLPKFASKQVKVTASTVAYPTEEEAGIDPSKQAF